MTRKTLAATPTIPNSSCNEIGYIGAIAKAPRRVRSADCKIHAEPERNSQFIGRGQEKSKKAVYVQSHFLTGFDVPDPVSRELE